MQSMCCELTCDFCSLSDVYIYLSSFISIYTRTYIAINDINVYIVQYTHSCNLSAAKTMRLFALKLKTPILAK